MYSGSYNIGGMTQNGVVSCQSVSCVGPKGTTYAGTPSSGGGTLATTASLATYQLVLSSSCNITCATLAASGSITS